MENTTENLKLLNIVRRIAELQFLFFIWKLFCFHSYTRTQEIHVDITWSVKIYSKVFLLLSTLNTACIFHQAVYSIKCIQFV